MIRTLMLFTICVLVLNACRQGESNQELNVFAAASLTDAFSEIARAFEAEHGVTVTVNYAGSSTLATQIIEGAPADIFASANPQQMNRIRDNYLISGTPSIFAQNEMILVVPVSNSAGIDELHDLANEGVKIVIAATGVPVRDYVDLVINQLADDPGYGGAFRDKLFRNVVSEEDNVRQSLAKIILGEADATFVYASDVPATETRVKILTLSDSLQPAIEYPIAVLQRTSNRESADAFITFVLSQRGQCILKQYGLNPVTDHC